MQTLNLIGAGRAGKTLARLWHQQGLLQVQAVICRSLPHAVDAVQFIGDGQPGDSLDGLPAADIWLIATPDDRIGDIACQLATGRVAGKAALHLSGSLNSDSLAPLRRHGLALASIHPIRSFADPALACAAFAGTPCGTEGDEAALALLQPLFAGIGARLLPIDASRKTLYHAGSVIACNYLLALVEAGLQCLETAGLGREAARQALQPLLQGTLDNLARLGPQQALTGPIVRGDCGTVAAHLQALQQDRPDLLPLYRVLGEQTLQLALPRLKPGAAETLAQLLQGKK